MNKNYKNVDAKLKALIKAYLEQGNIVLDYGVKVFDELTMALYPSIKDLTGYEEETLCYAIQRFFDDNIRDNSSLKKDNIENLIEYIKRIFNKNIYRHAIIYPLQKSILNKEIKFDNFYFLKSGREEEVLKKIKKYSKIEKKIVNDFLEHTKNSRSEDFLKFNLLIYKTNDNTQKLWYTSADMYGIIVNILNIMYRSNAFKNDTYSKLLLKTKMWEKPNKHVAILSNEWGRCGHSNMMEAPICDSNISFMSTKKSQHVFNKLLNILAKDTEDELILKFKRSYRIYMEAHKQYYEARKDEIALILYITCLESLVAENFNEKKLRFSIIAPALLDDIKDKHETSLHLKKLYEKRNSFIHNSLKPSLKYEDNDLEFIDSIVARFLLLLVDIEKIVKKYRNNNDTKLITAWNNLLNEKYEEHLFSFK